MIANHVLQANRRFEFFVDDCSPLMMLCTMYDAESTFSDWNYLSQLTELYLSLQ